MTDQEVLAMLAEKMEAEGGYAAVARALDVRAQEVHHWRNRGISAKDRYAVWELANQHGAKLPVSWLNARTAA